VSSKRRTQGAKVSGWFFSNKNCFLQAAAATILALVMTGHAHAQAVPDTLANQPNPSDFVKRTDKNFTLGGNRIRLGGMNVGWLALRSDTGHTADLRYPTPFEVDDMLATVQAMGGRVIRIVSAGATAGCALCLVPAPGKINEEALKQLDMILKKSADMGIQVIIPMAGAGAGCADGAELDPVAQSPCVYAKWRGVRPDAFFADPRAQADFMHGVTALLQHANSLTGIAYRDDPTILAWENCDACGAGVAATQLGAWTETLGTAIKALDTHHLYENGALVGRLVVPASESVLAEPSVDIVGDRVTPASPGMTTPPANIGQAAAAVAKAGRIYFIDEYGWSPKDWPTQDDFDVFLDQAVHMRDLSGALVTDLQGHADRGGYLPVPPNAGPESGLYFPGTATDAASAETMQARARAVRRFDYRVVNVMFPAFATVSPPTILRIDKGKIYWQGAAGATDYSVERSPDPHVNMSWQAVCNHCASDDHVPWQDKDATKDHPWYRLTPYNANAHAGLPSEPVQSQ
jgi:mannan endo-1,4-beta-mannosidase